MECFLFSAYGMMMLYICTKFHENILDDIKVTELKRFSLKKFSKGHTSTNIVNRITVLILCTWPDNGLYLCLVS